MNDTVKTSVRTRSRRNPAQHSTDSGPCLKPAPKKRQQHLCLLNARSAVSKAAPIHDVIADYKLDLAVVTETWFTSVAPNVVRLDIAHDRYCVIHGHLGSSKDQHGGGITIIHRESVNVFASTLENTVNVSPAVCLVGTQQLPLSVCIDRQVTFPLLSVSS